MPATYFRRDFMGRLLTNASPGVTTAVKDHLGRAINDPDTVDSPDNDETDYLGRLLTDPD